MMRVLNPASTGQNKPAHGIALGGLRSAVSMRESTRAKRPHTNPKRERGEQTVAPRNPPDDLFAGRFDVVPHARRPERGRQQHGET